MAQVNPESSYTSDTLARDVLRIVSGSQEPVQSIKPLLQVVLNVTGGHGAAFHLFTEPHGTITLNLDPSLLPEEDSLFTWSLELGNGVHIDPTVNGISPLPYEHWCIVPFTHQQNPVGLMLVAVDNPNHVDSAAFETVLEGLNMVTRVLRNSAYQEKINRNQREFIRIVLHDLRSPLTSMRGFGSMLESGMVGDLNEKQAYFVEKILSGINQMATLVENVQDAGRYDIENGFYEMERAPCDPVEILSRIIEHYLIPAEKQELTITTQVSPDIPIINADATMLERAITNLVDNAIKYTPNGGRIVVGMRTEQDSLVVWVQDTGLGINPEHQKKLFERHVRIPRNEFKKIKGTGLGLFIVRSVAQRHGGTTWVESSEGSGSTFYIKIPLEGPNAIP
jgi:signal transduction histidine kinase